MPAPIPRTQGAAEEVNKLVDGMTVAGSNLQPARAVGKAVDSRALARLLELWPRAYVMVQHYSASGQTVVRIYNRQPVEGDAGNGLEEVSREAACSEDDQFSRKHGIRLAFNRALKAVPR